MGSMNEYDLRRNNLNLVRGYQGKVSFLFEMETYKNGRRKDSQSRFFFYLGVFKIC